MTFLKSEVFFVIGWPHLQDLRKKFKNMILKDQFLYFILFDEIKKYQRNGDVTVLYTPFKPVSLDSERSVTIMKQEASAP